MGPIGCPETSVRNYYYTLRNRPEERSSHLFRGGSLKKRMDAFPTSGVMLQRHVVDCIWRNIYSQLLDKIQQLTRKVLHLGSSFCHLHMKRKHAIANVAVPAMGDNNFGYASVLFSVKPSWEFPLFLGAFAKLRRATIRFVMSVRPSICPHGTTRLPLDGFS
jgi:hypothetical protein